MKTLLIVGLLFSVVGCASQAEKDEQRLAQMREDIWNAQVWCEEAGVVPESPGWQPCYMNRYQSAKAQGEQASKARWSIIAAMLKSYSEDMKRRQALTSSIGR